MKIVKELNVELDSIEINTRSKLVIVRPKYWIDDRSVVLAQHFEADPKIHRIIEELLNWILQQMI
jgi:hypothetical protein